MFKIEKPPAFIPVKIDNDGTPATIDAFRVASKWLDEMCSSGWELASTVVVRGTTARCTLDSGEPGGGLLFRHLASPQKGSK